MKRIILVVFVLLTGCTTLGESEFKCGGIEAGIKCQPVSGVYADVTESNYSSERVEVVQPEKNLHRRGIGFGAGSHVRVASDVESSINTIIPDSRVEELLTLKSGNADSLIFVNPPSDSGKPQIVSEQRERILINAGVDTDGNYHEKHYIYFRSKDSHWVNDSSEQNKLFEPLK